MQRIRELTVQAANGSNSASDLKSIQDEIGERLSEIDRISKQTDFNGVKVLASNDNLKVQVGAHDNEVIEIELKQINVASLELSEFTVTTEVDVTDIANPSAFGASGFQIGTDPFSGTVFEHDGKYYIEQDNAVYEVTIVAPGTGDTTATIGVGSKVEGAEVDDNTLNLPGVYPGKAGLLEQLDGALQQVDDLRSHLGAIQNRFESTITNLNNTVNNLSAARSRIEDADYAVEVSNMTRAQILQQAGTSVLAQANQVPQTVLSLLR